MPYAGPYFNWTPSRKTGSNFTSAKQKRKQGRQKRSKR